MLIVGSLSLSFWIFLAIVGFGFAGVFVGWVKWVFKFFVGVFVARCTKRLRFLLIGLLGFCEKFWVMDNVFVI